MFKVIKKPKSKEKRIPVEVNDYVEKNKIPATVEFAVKNKIREYRENLGLNQTHVAAMLNITRQSLSLIENGKQIPSILISYLIARVLNVDVAELFYFEEIGEDEYEEKK